MFLFILAVCGTLACFALLTLSGCAIQASCGAEDSGGDKLIRAIISGIVNYDGPDDTLPRFATKWLHQYSGTHPSLRDLVKTLLETTNPDEIRYVSVHRQMTPGKSDRSCKPYEVWYRQMTPVKSDEISDNISYYTQGHPH